MRILLFSTLFPNAAAPAHGVFVENRLAAYKKKHKADIKVIAPVPWFPFKHSMFGAYADFARVTDDESRQGVDVFHPRYLIPPKLAMHVAPGALTRCLRNAAERLISDGWDFDLIDAHYFYPDGVAAAKVARELGKPFVVTARGSDINLLPTYAGPRELILDTAHRADAVVTVAAALKNELARLGAPQEKITVLRNGVDLDRFSPTDREEHRRILGVEGLVLASVGHLIERKGHDLVIDALTFLPSATLLIAGSGPLQKALELHAKMAGVADRVRFLGQASHDELRSLYSAADILVLASSREGWPNVLLEAMACGTPCVATNVWGSSEVITAPAAGRLAKDRTANSIAAAVKDLLAEPPGRKATRAYAEQHSWDATADGVHVIFSSLYEKSRARAGVETKPIALEKSDYRPQLMVTVDTEETFDWSRFDTADWRVEAPAGLERFQEICAQRNVPPLYFLTLPMLKDERSAAYFQELSKRNKADFGLHLHQWATPPGELRGEFYSFQKNLPTDIYLKKLQSLSAAFQQVFGRRAISHRAGRYGIDKACYKLLAEVGIELDFSPSAAFDFSARGGPDFSSMSNFPFEVSGNNWCIDVTPVCGAQAIRRTRSFLSQESEPPGFAPYRKQESPAMKRAMRLSPEGASLAELQALTRRLLADKTPVLTFTLHSTSLTPGANIYAVNEASVDELLQVSAAYFDWFKDTIGGYVTSLPELRQTYDSARQLT
ncbi:glycosyltransferase [Hyphococcus sp.]|uniref:glycosyltransferase n=1 Tax=Hyphococcus sp. TaxID=2038636 RepID=UPI002087E696|nr:MAG: hypothetical protein DHS20C04_11620 [Marinicaulis sp.]